MQIKIIKFSEIDDVFINKWKLISDTYFSPFLSMEWQRPLFGSKKNNYKIITGFYNEELVFLSPLKYTAHGLMVKIGGYISSEQQRIALVNSNFETEEITDLLVEKLTGLFNRPVIACDFIKKEDILALSLIKKLKLKGWSTLEFDGKKSPYLHLENDFETYLKTVKRSVVKEYLRRKKKLEKDYPVEIKLVTEKNELIKHLPEIIRVEHSSWRQDDGIFSSGNLDIIIRQLKALSSSNMLRLFLLITDGKLIAYDIEFLHGKNLWTYNRAFDPGFKKYGPGINLQMEAVKYGFENRLKSVEFLGDNRPYKQPWSNGIHSRSIVFLFPPGIKGIIGRIIIKTGKKIKNRFK